MQQICAHEDSILLLHIFMAMRVYIAKETINRAQTSKFYDDDDDDDDEDKHRTQQLAK